jgi:hypothetical protein
MQSWFYESGGKSLGPVSDAQIVDLFKSGSLDGISLVWSPQIGGAWKPLNEVESLKAAMQAEPQDEEDTAAKSDVQTSCVDSSLPVAIVSASRLPQASINRSDAWYYADPAGERVGPVPVAALASLVAAELIIGSTLVWREGFDSWSPASSVMEFSGLLISSLAVTGTKKRQPGIDSGGLDSEVSSDTRGTAEALEMPTDGVSDVGVESSSKRKRTGKGSSALGKAKENPWVYIVGELTETMPGPVLRHARPNKYATGLPHDITERSLEAHFKRAGIVKNDPATSMPRVKIYRCGLFNNCLNFLRIR